MAMKIFWWVVAVVITFMFIFGILVPYMISSASTELVVGGIIVMVLFVALLINYGMKLFNFIKNN